MLWKLYWLHLARRYCIQNLQLMKIVTSYILFTPHMFLFPRFKSRFHQIYFSFTQYSINLSVADALFSLMLQDREQRVQLSDTKPLRENVVDFATKITTITMSIKQKCQHTMNLRKKGQGTFLLLCLDTNTVLCLDQKVLKNRCDMSLPKNAGCYQKA